MSISKVAVIGLGKLGLCTAACFARAGYQVVGVDVSSDHIECLKRGEVTFFEEGLKPLLAEVNGRLSFTMDIKYAVDNSEACFIIVPTPSQAGGAFSNKYVMRVLKSMASALAAREDWYLVDVVSTVMPGSSTTRFQPLLEEMTGKKVGKEIGLAYNPEFIAIGSVISNFLNPDLVLIGESDQRTGDTLEEVYRNTCNNSPHIARTFLINAEIAKITLNCYCTMKISFANNLAAICSKVKGADGSEVASILGYDSRIGHKYIKPGLGFGGPCFPRDNQAFVNFVEEVNGCTGLQEAVLNVNKKQPELAAERITQAWDGKGKVALLGQAYKPHTYLTEESQAVMIGKILSIMHPDMKLAVFDPLAKEYGPWELAESLEACADGASVAAILTPWPEFFENGWHSVLAEDARIVDFWQ